MTVNAPGASVTLEQISERLAKFRMPKATIRRMAQIITNEKSLEAVRKALQDELDAKLLEELRQRLGEWSSTTGHQFQILALAQGYMGTDDLHPCLMPIKDLIEESTESFAPTLFQLINGSQTERFRIEIDQTGTLRLHDVPNNVRAYTLQPPRDVAGLDFWVRAVHKLIDETLADQPYTSRFVFNRDLGSLLLFSSELVRTKERFS